MAKTTKRDLTAKEWQWVRMKRAKMSSVEIAIQANATPAQVSQYFNNRLFEGGTQEKRINFAIESLLSERVNPESAGGGE
jgi:hypothetical protein